MACSHKPVRDSKHGEVTCSECGEVLDESVVSLEKEYVHHGDESSAKKEHYGPGGSYRRADKGLGSSVGKYGYLPRARPPKTRE
jgi:transcription initiation factor TFIIIB Brf1 subunit/transcription initiation factor TFIIB